MNNENESNTQAEREEDIGSSSSSENSETPVGSPENSSASEEDKNKLLEAIKNLFKSLYKILYKIDREFLLGRLIDSGVIGNKSSIVERLKNIEKDMETIAVQNDITSDSIVTLAKVINEMDGKLSLITPDNYNQVLGEIETEITKAVETERQKSVSMAEGTDILNSIYAELVSMGHFQGKDSAHDFILAMYSASVITKKDGSGNANDTFYMDIDGELLKIKFEKTETKDGNSHWTAKVDNSESAKNRIRIYETKRTLKPDYIFVNNNYKTAVSKMVNEFCRKNGMNFVVDYEKESKRIEDEILAAHPQVKFLKQVVDTVVTSDDGRYESSFDSKSNTFIVRDTKTKEMLRVKAFPDTKSLNIYLAKNTTDIKSQNTGVCFGTWEQTDKGTLKSIYNIETLNDAVTRMLRSKEMQQYLEQNGISKQRQEESMRHYTDTLMCKVEKKYKYKIDRLENACNAAIAKTLSDDGDYSVKRIDYLKDNTFLQIHDKKGNELSFSFSEDGVPLALRYKKAGEKEKRRFVRNYATKGVSRDFDKLCAEDPDFVKLHEIAQKAMQKSGLLREANRYLKETVSEYQNQKNLNKKENGNIKKPKKSMADRIITSGVRLDDEKQVPFEYAESAEKSEHKAEAKENTTVQETSKQPESKSSAKPQKEGEEH